MMISGSGKEADRRVRPIAAAVVLSSILMLGACASGATIEDAVPRASADGTYGGPRDTGQYPNLNIRQKAATSQLTDKQVAAKTTELNTARTTLEAQPADTAAASADAARIRQVGKTHGKEALKDIEGQ